MSIGRLITIVAIGVASGLDHSGSNIALALGGNAHKLSERETRFSWLSNFIPALIGGFLATLVAVFFRSLFAI
ncbi:hypothetical protein E0485_17305 [Paenibacillus albiflavus]|uniref:Uncharacterized protein n=1 Tax=Paenibacillus albiflavus TaxID=2545760 RepID=A0A4R4EC18_9BACL|nr:hypothetical protein [Paenibacillus albiflavus]TCZ75488.1 hypothetical protein E0485_17305 [Paenibacillus albiflavus]